jgi:uncharacterized protein YdiU (UPF0061 family)
MLKLENTYTSLPSAFFNLQKPVPVERPEIVCFNEKLAADLGLDSLKGQKEKIAAYFSGNELIEGSNPLAQAYAGHQFGHFTMLGDGRAILLGEHLGPNGKRFDIQLKGSGQTPYSRQGDGRATLYSMLREYLISEAMHHLNIPTTRSLAVVASGEKVYRETVHQGAVLTRIAESHIRVGTFEFARNFRSIDELKALTNYTIKRHYPQLVDADNPPFELLKTVLHKQIDLIVNWMRVGFIHGVMNTDNMSIAGETIDYGPCAFMNTYNRKTVFSSIDSQGRYAFGNQPNIAQWNITAFANALLPIISEDQKKAISLARQLIDDFEFKFLKRYYQMLYAKIGIVSPNDEDKELVDRLLMIMEANKADYTQVFIALQEDKIPKDPFYQLDEFKEWQLKWSKRIERDMVNSKTLMKNTNPTVIPRNHWVENVLKEAVKGDISPFNELLETLTNPYGNHSDELTFQQVPSEFDSCYQTYCGT